MIDRDPTKVRYDGLDVYGMAPSSSGGTTVGEALNILTPQHLRQMTTPQALHTYLEASALAFADRGAYVGDPAYVNVPTKELLSRWLRRRAVLPDRPGQARRSSRCRRVRRTARTRRARRASRRTERPDTEGLSTTHLVAADKWGNVVSYTLTIEQTGGSGITSRAAASC